MTTQLLVRPGEEKTGFLDFALDRPNPPIGLERNEAALVRKGEIIGELGTSGHQLRVDYALPFGPLGTVARALFVRRSLERIFGHRRQAVTALFGAA